MLVKSEWKSAHLLQSRTTDESDRDNDRNDVADGRLVGSFDTFFPWKFEDLAVFSFGVLIPRSFLFFLREGDVQR